MGWGGLSSSDGCLQRQLNWIQNGLRGNKEVGFSGGRAGRMLSGDGICLHVFGARSIRYVEVKLFEKESPPSLTRVKLFSLSDVDKIFDDLSR